MSRKLSIDVEQTDDGGFRVELSTGWRQKQTKVAESLDSLVAKVSESLRSELGEARR